MSSKATRQSFGEVLRDIGKEFPNVVVLDADLSCSTKSNIFAKEFPGRFFQMGIAEANMVGTAAGMASTGLVPFLCSFGCFVAGRYETIRVSVGYSKANVKIVGTHSGLGIGGDGYSQMGLEDLNIMRGLPGMAVLNPADEATTRAAVRFSAQHDGPVYLRLTRQGLPNVHPSEDVFTFGKGIVLKEGADKIALLGSGAGVEQALKAADGLAQLNPWVADIHTIQPIDKDLITQLAERCQWLVTVEDHNIVGGLGSAVAEVLAENRLPAQLLRIGVEDYGESGEPKDLYEKYGISANKVVDRVGSLFR